MFRNDVRCQTYDISKCEYDVFGVSCIVVVTSVGIIVAGVSPTVITFESSCTPGCQTCTLYCMQNLDQSQDCSKSPHIAFPYRRWR